MHILCIIAPLDVTTNTQAVAPKASEENVVGINLEDGKCSQLDIVSDVTQLQVKVLVHHQCCRED